ncbi:MAG: hypothetical protein PHI97_20680 [Desulfobulbus sp.]|nr:hypothetical protein [Desulfobulbus sp.]
MRQNQARYCGWYSLFLLMVWANPLGVSLSWAQFPVPSQWQGEISGQVHGTFFRIPVTLALSSPISGEQNPFHVFIGAGETDQFGHVTLSSAIQVNTRHGLVTLKYLSVTTQDTRFSAHLTQDHTTEAAKINGFSGPNVSAAEVSTLMKDVLRNAWGSSEMFGFSVGTRLVAEQRGHELWGTLAGSGRSCTGTSSEVFYQAQFKAVRMK